VKTRDLIQLLVEDGKRPLSPLGTTVALLFLSGAAIVVAIFAVFVGMRPDFSEAIWTVRVVFKMAIVATLAVAGFGLLLQLGRPTARVAPWIWFVAVLAAVLLAGSVVELFVIPANRWVSSLNGSNRTFCLVAIPALSVIPLVAAIIGLRSGAPRNSTLAGAGAGLAAAAVGATLYALNCNNDSPLFVAAWYPIAIGFVVLTGATLGRATLRW
jgi:hypothetical protein